MLKWQEGLCAHVFIFTKPYKNGQKKEYCCSFALLVRQQQQHVCYYHDSEPE